MAAHPFPPAPQRGLAGRIRRLLGRRHPANALVELRKLLAEVPSLAEVDPGQVAEIEERFGLELARDFPGEVQGLYRDFVAYCLADRRFSDEELGNARHLAVLLGLPGEVCELIHRKVAREAYLRSIEEVMADGNVDPEERKFLRELQAHLQIPEEVARNMEEVRRRQLRSRGRWGGE